MKKESKGITLIALVITIIVLLILAGVTVTTLTGDNGLLQKTTNAKNVSKEGELQEEVKLAFQEYEIDKYTNSNVSIENKLRSIFEKIHGIGNITVDKSGKNYKIKIKDSKTCYRVRYNGTVQEYEEMDPTNVYAKLDSDGTLYLRSSQISGYTLYSDSRSWTFPNSLTTSDVKKIIIEEKIAPTTAVLMFYNYINLTEIENIKNLHTENITTMSDMFCNCSSLISLDLSQFDTFNVTGMYEMFYGCSNLTNLNFDNFNTSNVNSMGHMFNGCKFSNIDLSSFDTSNVKNMNYMFYGCNNLTNLNLTYFNTSNVTSIHRMFQGCSSLENLNISSFDTSNVTDMFAMTHQCSNLKNINLGKNFVINNNTSYEYLASSRNDVKIIAIQDTANKIIDSSNLTIDNFTIIN